MTLSRNQRGALEAIDQHGSLRAGWGGYSLRTMRSLRDHGLATESSDQRFRVSRRGSDFLATRARMEEARLTAAEPTPVHLSWDDPAPADLFEHLEEPQADPVPPSVCYGCFCTLGPNRSLSPAVFADTRTGRGYCLGCVEVLVSWELDGSPGTGRGYAEWIDPDFQPQPQGAAMSQRPTVFTFRPYFVLTVNEEEQVTKVEVEWCEALDYGAFEIGDPDARELEAELHPLLSAALAYFDDPDRRAAIELAAGAGEVPE